MEPKGKNTPTSGKDLNKDTVLKIHLPFQLLYASALFCFLSRTCFLFFCSLHDRLYSYEHLVNLYVAIYSATP